MYETNHARLQSRQFVYNIQKWDSHDCELYTGQQFPGNDTVVVDPQEYVLVHHHPDTGRLYARRQVIEVINLVNLLADMRR